MPSDSEILNHLLEAERKAKELIEDAQRSVNQKIEEFQRAKEIEFRSFREQMQKEADEELRALAAELAQQKENALLEAQKKIEDRRVDKDKGQKVLKSLLGIL